jgi:putative ABC transport system ATP-binding protein
MPKTLIDLKDIQKTFKVGIQDVHILKGVSFSVEKGDFIILLGPSGCGKSTLLHILLGLEYPSEGKVIVEGKDFYASGVEDDRSEYRKHNVGMIFQKPNWVQALNVLDNVLFPLTLLDADKVTSVTRANQVLDIVGMVNWSQYRPNELSSGQQQKVSLARSIVTDPDIIVADEPTGNLDFDSVEELRKIMVELKAKVKTIIMVTHY